MTFIRLLSAVFSAFATQVAYAQLNVLPSTPCPGIVGCGGGSQNVILENIPQLATLMITLGSGAAVLFIAWAGFKMVLALGDDGQIAEQKSAILYVLGGLGIAILSQTIVTLVGTEPNLNDITPGNLPVDALAAGVRIILTLFNGVFAVAIIIGGIRMVYAQGKSDEFNTGRRIIVWSIFGAVVTNLANALVQALAAIFGV